MIELQLLTPPFDEPFIAALHALAERVYQRTGTARAMLLKDL